MRQKRRNIFAIHSRLIRCLTISVDSSCTHSNRYMQVYCLAFGRRIKYEQKCKKEGKFVRVFN
jgi:hypothetical protein